MIVPLTRGKAALISDEDAALVAPYKWSAKPTRTKVGRWYAQAHSRGKTIYMHRLIANAQAGEEIDHRNRDGLDNRRENLRRCDRSMNNANAVWAPSVSGFRGVAWHKRGGFWKAQVWVKRRRILAMDCFYSPADAARARDKLAIEHYGEFAILNFPLEERA